MNAPKINLYGADWPANADPLSIERECIRRNGKWQRKNGEQAGNGLAFHYRRFQELLWPEKIWEKGPYKNFWAEQCLAAYLSHTYIGAMGCAASGKSDSFGSNVLTDWYCWPEVTTVLVSSTELKSLELRIWGMIKRYHRSAKERYPWLPGHLIEGRQMIVEHSREESQAGREFKNGIMAVACKRGDRYVGLGSYIGIHNKRVRLLADECFPAGTMVDTPGGPIPIEQLKTGDMVLGAAGPNKVLRTVTRIAETLVRIYMRDGLFVDCTPEHPFLTLFGWVEAFKLQPHQHIMTPRERLGVMGWSTPDRQLVRNVEILKRAGDKRYIESEGGYRVHNLEVEGSPTYSVQGLLVHNCNLMPRAFLDSAANLSKCEDFKMVGLGNPNETTNAHGLLCEPHPDDGGWEAGIDQSPGTKTWRTKFPNGVCIQLPGSDSPNMKAPPGQRVPFPFLITRKQMEEDAQIWGVDDWHYTMMNESRMPRGQGSRRVLTRQTCEKFGAFRKPEWRDNVRTSITFLDAAFRGVGGDRCVFGELQFGSEATPIGGAQIASSIINQGGVETKYPQIVALVDLMVVPIKSGRIHESPEDQIVWFVKNEHQRRNIPPENFYYDAGMRTSLVQAFSRGWSTMVNSIDSMGKPSEEKVSAEIDKPCCEYYSKFVTELWFSVRLVVESGQFRGMTDELCGEFSAREWKMATGNRIEVESKEEMKAKIGRSPDLADAVAYGIYGCRRRGFVISRQFNEGRNRTRRGRDWRDEIRDRARAAWQSGSLVYSA